MKKIVIVSGYFNPIHRGHIEYFKKAKTHGHKLWVIVNNDRQRELKGSKHFMDEEERRLIVESIKYVNEALISVDTDRTVCQSLRMINNTCKTLHPDLKVQLYFANGGDQKNDLIPEKAVCEELGIILIDGLGDKIQSSSWLLDEKRDA